MMPLPLPLSPARLVLCLMRHDRAGEFSHDVSGAGWGCVPIVAVNSFGSPDKGCSTLPQNWPASVTYTPFLIWESPQAAQLRLRATCCSALPTVRIRKLSKSHPASEVGDSSRTGSRATTEPQQRKRARRASGQVASYGLFARLAIPCGTLIGDFTGQVKPQQGRDQSKYLLEVFHDPIMGISLDVDAEHYGNETRFINDYKSLRSEPNVGFTLYHSASTGETLYSRRTNFVTASTM